MKPLTYPARPVNGGPLEHAPAKIGAWAVEPKYNGWRVLVHVPSGIMFNRHGEQLSIAEEFRNALRELQASPFTWLDCEGLSRRHGHGKGTLIVLDIPDSPATYIDRHTELAAQFCPLIGGCHNDTVFSVPAYTDARAVYSELKLENQHNFRCEFYEGIVMKRLDSHYSVQLLSPERETPTWVKHRWHF